MSSGRIVVRPMHDRRSSAIVHHLAADLDAVAGLRGTLRGDVNVVDDFHRSGGAAHVERFVHAVCAGTVEISRR